MSLWTIPFTDPFLPTLARGLGELLGERLPDALVLLPSRRACLAFREALLPEDGSVLLCPRLQPIGEVEEDELVLDAGDALDLEPAIDPIRRRLLLARLVRAVEQAQGLSVNVDRSMRLAGDLARFMDELQTEEIATDGLNALVPDDLAEHWQRTLEFLKILETAWPGLLAAEHRADPAERRRRLLDARAQAWQARPPGCPVVVAGVTGTIPAVARLIQTVAGLDDGHVVLQGVDRELPRRTWETLPPTHPQAPMAALLAKLGTDRALVRPWPIRHQPSAIDHLLRRVGEVGGNDDTIPPSITDQLTIETWREPAEAALSTALHLRAVLEEPGRTAALVTADRNFARRVAIELARYGIVVDDSAGTPLDQTPPGSLMLLAAHAAVEDYPPAALLALLKHPLARGCLDLGTFRRMVRALERGILRGPRPGNGLAGIARALLAVNEKHWSSPVPPDELAQWLNELRRQAEPLSRLLASGERVDPMAVLTEHLAFVRWLAGNEVGDPVELFAREAGAALSDFLGRFEDALAGEEPLAPSAWPALLAVLMAEIPVRPHRPRHPRIAIRGRFEARLLHADRVVIAGLDEGSWPENVDPGPWLNRSMRRALGLPTIDARIGAAGHDLLGQFGADRIILLRARRDAIGSPTKPSRFLVRIEAALRNAGLFEQVQGGAGRHRLIERLDGRDPASRSVPRPRPTPGRAARPTEIWATEIETLLDDPYVFYARKVLNLKELEPLDADAGAAERGTSVHLAMDRFIERFPAELPDDPLAALLACGEQAFARFGHYPQVHALWWPRFERAARMVVDAERQRRCPMLRIRSEETGLWGLTVGGRSLTLKARADRVELRPDGRVALIDYKTGSMATKRDVEDLRKPQILIVGLIARNGRYGSIERAKVTELALWSLAGREALATTLDNDVEALLIEVEERLVRLLAWYDDPHNPYPAIAKSRLVRRHDPFDHLARVAEWTAEAEPSR